MGTLHVVPGHTAEGSLRHVLKHAGIEDEVLSFGDDLSCGPIDPYEPATRAAWWRSFYDDSADMTDLHRFWERVSATDDRLVVWVGHHSARELAFFLAWVGRMGERPFEIVDVTGTWLPVRRFNGSYGVGPATRVSTMSNESFRLLLGRERAMTPEEHEATSRHWRTLCAENAPFRVVTNRGLVSAPLDHFDEAILRQATAEWQRVAHLVHYSIGTIDNPYDQIGDVMVRMRLAALVEDGRLLADGNPWEMRVCNVRLAD